MGSVDYLSYGFALVVLSGGVIGYFKVGKECECGAWCALIRTTPILCTGSVMSLVSGITFGGLLAYGAYQTSANPKNFIFLFGKVFALLSLKI